ncbi:MAG: LacI family DNA-binding transcriptional regulator, partial [Victivallaceae bacterium]|nr:LacI family DNA-binding transcriptional regulator [Victivallaceae bacterium]
MKKVTSQMLADMLGLSRATVSRALNRHASVPPETVERVIRAAEATDYRFTPRGGRRTYGVILYRNAVIYSYLAMTISALRLEAHRRKCQLELVSIDDLDLLGERVLSGVIDLSHDFTLNDRWGAVRTLPLIRFY